MAPYLQPFACLECRKTVKSEKLDDSTVCPHCRGTAWRMSRKFRVPAVRDLKEWELVRFYVRSGFRFQKIYRREGRGLVQMGYPTDREDAKAFVQRFKGQAWTVPPEKLTYAE